MEQRYNTKQERLHKLLRFIVYYFDIPVQSCLRTIAERCNKNRANLSSALSGNERFLTDALIESINNKFGNPFNIEWLLYGTGEMLNTNSPAPVADNSEYTRTIMAQQRTISDLTRLITNFTNR